MPGTTSSSDAIEQFKRAFRNLFRRRKLITVGTIIKAQAPSRAQRPRSASAVAAPEVLPSPDIPSWPFANHQPPAGGYYCSPVELPGSLAPLIQQRSKSEVGPPIVPSDIFSELDATSLRRLSVVGSEAGDNVLDEEYTKLQAELANQEQIPDVDPQTQALQAALSEVILERKQSREQEQAEPTRDEAEFQDAEEHLPLERETENLIDAALIPLPEDSDSDLEDDASTLSAAELERNDSANGGKVFRDDSSSVYSSDESDIDMDSATDAGTVSTPRTASLARADIVEYFDEKIPVLCEPPQVLPIAVAPGMAATSGPLEDFSF